MSYLIKIWHCLNRSKVLSVALFTGFHTGMMRADVIHSVSRLYGAGHSSSTDLINTFHFGFNENDNVHFLDPLAWEWKLLTIDPFSDSVWGQTFTLNSGNTANFANFAAQVTDGEVDWLGYSFISDSGGGSGWIPNEPYYFYSDFSGASGIDLNGYRIDELVLRFEEYHWPQTYQVQGKLTISFIGESLNSVPEARATAGLLGLSLFCLAPFARRNHD